MKTISIESSIARKLDIRFIDAKTLVNEAKVDLGIVGYSEESDWEKIFERACDLFDNKGTEEQLSWRKAHWDLESSKIPTGSLCMSSLQDASFPDHCFTIQFLSSDQESTSGGSTMSSSSSVRTTTSTGSRLLCWPKMSYLRSQQS